MGVKEDEIRWVGVNDFIDELKAKNNGQDVSFDKKDLVDYIRENHNQNYHKKSWCCNRRW